MAPNAITPAPRIVYLNERWCRGGGGGRKLGQVHAQLHTSLLLERSASQRVVGDCESAAIDGTYGSLDEGKRAQEPGDGQGGLKYDAVGILTVVAAAASA